MRVRWRLLRFAFRLLYHELAFSYDVVSKIVSFGAWRCWQRAALKHLDAAPGSPILELAHGTGDTQLDLHHAGYAATGIDLSPNMGRIARRKLTRQRRPARLVRSRAQQLPFAAGSFAAVIATFPAEFIVAEATLREARRVLRAGGHFIIVPNAQLSGKNPAEAGLEWLYRVTGQRGGASHEVAAFFEPYGFAVRVVREHCPRSMVQVIVAAKMP